MGNGIRMARKHPQGGDLHADVLDSVKDQLLIVLMKRLQDKDGKVSIPVAELDDTGHDMLAFSVQDYPGPRARFEFQLTKKGGA